VALKINLPVKLVTELEPVLATKGLSLDEAVRLYLRSLVTTSARGRALELDSVMPFGKYQGEVVEVIVRAEPSYIRFLIANVESCNFTPAVLALLDGVGPKPALCAKPTRKYYPGDTLLSDLDIGWLTTAALKRGGIETVAQFTATPIADILKIKGIGRRRLLEVQNEIEAVSAGVNHDR